MQGHRKYFRTKKNTNKVMVNSWKNKKLLKKKKKEMLSEYTFVLSIVNNTHHVNGM